jgi:hypothetical protein
MYGWLLMLFLRPSSVFVDQLSTRRRLMDIHPNSSATEAISNLVRYLLGTDMAWAPCEIPLVWCYVQLRKMRRFRVSMIQGLLRNSSRAETRHSARTPWLPAYCPPNTFQSKSDVIYSVQNGVYQHFSSSE